MYMIVLCSYSIATDSEKKQQCVTLDNENDFGSIEKWQVYQLYETWLSAVQAAFIFRVFEGIILRYPKELLKFIVLFEAIMNGSIILLF